MCWTSPLSERIDSAYRIFVGVPTLLETKSYAGDSWVVAQIKSLLGLPPNHAHSDVIAHFRITEPLDGLGDDDVTVVTAASGGACGYTFRLDAEHLVFASLWRDSQKRLSTGLCSGTSLAADASDEIESLRRHFGRE